MKFISKNSNLRIVLEPGIQSNQLSGIAGRPGVYVKFQNGVVNVSDEELVNKMTSHPGFNLDFIAVDESGEDPFIDQREEIEPTHVLTDIKYGHAEGKKLSPNRKAKIDPQIKKLIDEKAMELVNKMLPKMVEETVKKMIDIGAEKAKEAKEAETIKQTKGVKEAEKILERAKETEKSKEAK